MKKICLIVIIFFFQIICFANKIPLDAEFDVGFSPKNGALDTVLKGIKAAKKQILVAAYSFTSKPIAIALLNAHKLGIHVFVIGDYKSNVKKYSSIQFLANQGVSVRLNKCYKIYHHKFMVIDHQHVQLGSFNYSHAAAYLNAENVLLLWNVAPIAKIYSQEWQKLWNEAIPLNSNY